MDEVRLIDANNLKFILKLGVEQGTIKTLHEERDDYRIPEGWWEYRHFNPDDIYNNKIDRPVVGWMTLPKKPKGVA